MYEKIKYVNHLNETIEFGKDGVYANHNDLRDYNWIYDSDNDIVSNFRRGITTKILPIFIFGISKEKALQNKNQIFEVFEKDVLANKKGTLWIGDYYYKCFVIGSVNSEYLTNKRLLKKEVSIVTETPIWIKETVYNFYRQDQTVGKSSYPYGYSFDYSNNLDTQRLLNDHFTDSNFKLIVYGPVNNPTVFINGYPYSIYTEILEGERVVIDSIDKTVVKIKMNGDTINEFNKRNKVYSVFKKIAQGSNTVSFDGTFDFEVRLFEERSEPKWI